MPGQKSGECSGDSHDGRAEQIEARRRSQSGAFLAEEVEQTSGEKERDGEVDEHHVHRVMRQKNGSPVECVYESFHSSHNRGVGELFPRSIRHGSLAICPKQNFSFSMWE